MTAAQAADWMLVQFNLHGFLYQEEAASHLLHLDDEALAYYDKSGNDCVGKHVLDSFTKLTPEIVYQRAGKYWRIRLETDQPGRQQ